MSVTSAVSVAHRPRSFVRVSGPDAEDFLQRMLSNDVAAVAPGGGCDALLLTAKGRVVAPLRVVRRERDFLLLTEPDLGERVARELTRFRFAAKVQIEPEDASSRVVFADAPPDGLAVKTDEYGSPAWEVIGDGAPPTISADQLELMRIEAGTPRWGAELDETVLPAEAGLEQTHISFTKGCYPGQEPIARLHYRGHVNRRLRTLEVDGEELPARNDELLFDGRPVGRITSAARRPDGTIVALAYVRTSVADDAVLHLGAGTARLRR